MVDLKQSTFTGNTASQGAALMAIKEMNFDYSTSLFIKNTADYGGDLTSTPTSLSLKIYYVNPYFLYLKDITPQDLLSHPSTVKSL